MVYSLGMENGSQIDLISKLFNLSSSWAIFKSIRFSFGSEVLAVSKEEQLMDRRLYDASREGNIAMLHNLIDEDPLTLDRVCILGAYSETPLHIAAMLGHVDFAREILRLKRSLASQTDLHKSTPLHFAVATNNSDMVELLYNASPEMCLAHDRYGRNPLHVAAIKGRTDVLKWLLHVNHPDAARIKTDDGDSILHLCVKYSQVESLKVLIERMVDEAFINSVDRDGNTALHLAVLDKQFEAVNFLLQNPTIKVNAKNLKLQTALDILYMEGDSIGRALRRAGALFSCNVVTSSSPPLQQGQGQQKRSEDRQQDVERMLDKATEPGLIAASVIAAATYQAGVSPPRGVWQDTTSNHTAGKSILAYEDMGQYNLFLLFNTTAFFASITIFILLLARFIDLPLKSGRRSIRTTAFLALAILAVNSWPLSYILSIEAVTPYLNDWLRVLFVAACVMTLMDHLIVLSSYFRVQDLQIFSSCYEKCRVILVPAIDFSCYALEALFLSRMVISIRRLINN